MEKYVSKHLINIISIIGLLLTSIFIIYCYSNGIFDSQANMTLFLNKFGIFAPIIFVIMQAVQVIVPVIPANITCGLAVIFWGGIKGFILNYIGICAGSIIVFLLARNYGKAFVKKIIGSDKYIKYEEKFNKNGKFEKLFAILIFLPFAPDDFLCYFAGITNIKISKFIIIILFGKVFGIISYSLFLTEIFKLFGIR